MAISAVYETRCRPARQYWFDVVKGEHAQRCERFHGGASHVRHQEGILDAEIVVVDVGFMLQDIEAGCPHSSRLQSSNEILVANEVSACRVAPARPVRRGETPSSVLSEKGKP